MVRTLPSSGKLISPYTLFREQAREHVCDGLIKMPTKCPLGTCIERDVEGLYKKSFEGKIRDRTGVQDSV